MLSVRLSDSGKYSEWKNKMPTIEQKLFSWLGVNLFVGHEVG